MLDEELARVQNGRCGRYGHHLPNHDVGKLSFARAQDEPAGRNHALQPPLLVDDVEVNDSATWRVLAQPLHRLANRLFHQKARKILAHVPRNQVF